MKIFFEIGFYLVLVTFVLYGIRKSKEFHNINQECENLKNIFRFRI